MKRFSPILLTFLLVFSCFPISNVSASEEYSFISTFLGGSETADVSLQGDTTDLSVQIEIPRNVTLSNASFTVEVDASKQSPGQMWIDINQDGLFEWDFNGTGYGGMGSQNEYYDGSTSYTTNLTSGPSLSPGILLPHQSDIESLTLDVRFTPQSGGGYFQIGEYQQVIESDIDGDGLPEPVFLTAINATDNSTSIIFADWTAVGITISNPIPTCDNATSISVGDLNGDGNQDIIAFSTISSHTCVHLANTTSFDPVVNFSLSGGLLDAKLGDLDKDGSDDIISIHQNGILNISTWSNITSAVVFSSTQQINENNTPNLANLVTLYVDDFFNNGSDSILVIDLFGNCQHWESNGIGLTGPVSSFDGMQGNHIVTDLDGDGDIDLFGNNELGYSFFINNGTHWRSNTIFGELIISNSAIADFNGDGNLDLLVPNSGVSDGQSSTVDGNISYRNINSTEIGNVTAPVLEPWSMPTSVIVMDMDNDSVLEHIIGAGELDKGVFIGGWHDIELDADGDGVIELEASGYATGNTSNSPANLTMQEDSEGIVSDLRNMSAVTQTPDSYGIQMDRYSMEVSSSGIGAFTFGDLDISYSCEFLVEVNPHASTNLSNVLNQGMSGGIGNYTVSIPINSTDAGEITLSKILVSHTPGAPFIQLPIVPTLQLDYVTDIEVALSWDDHMAFGLDLVEFEVFRLESETATVPLTEAYKTQISNVMYDTNVSSGSTYWYLVRSIHDFGVTSNLSNTLEVTVPYPAPLPNVEGITVTDVENDSGGELAVSWNLSSGAIDHYDVYLENNSFSNISGLTSIANVSSSQNSTIITNLIDAQEYWVAIVAVDVYGNSTNSVISVGPYYSKNNVPFEPEYEIAVGSAISLGSPFSLELIIHNQTSGIENGGILVSMETNSGTYPISTNWDAIDLSDFRDLGIFTPDVYGEVTFWANFSGLTGDAQNRDASPKSVSTTSTVYVGATISSSKNTYELDLENKGQINISLEATDSLQSALLEGANLTWSIHNTSSNISLTGTEQIANGSSQFIVNFSGGGILYVNVTDPLWISTGLEPLEINLIPYGTNVEQNGTNNESNQTVWSPNTMDDLTIDCGQVIIDPSQVQEIDCTISNSNNYSIQVSLESDGWSDWEEYIAFEPTPGQGEFVLTSGASSVIEIRVEVLQNLSENGLPNGLIKIDIRQGPLDYTFPIDKPLTFDIPWTLIGEEPVVDTEPKDNNTNKKSDTDDSASNKNMVIFGGVGAVAFLVLVVIIVLRIRNSDLDEWGEEDLDMDPELKTDRVAKPLPVGVALDEFEDKTIIDETPDRPDYISDFDNSEDYVETLESAEESQEIESDVEYDGDYVEESEDESGITTDENGTEWYEDEVGVWWFRDEGEEDWSEFVE